FDYSDSSYLLNNFLIGSSTETISNTGFVLDGDDLFVADKLGVEGILYNDGGIRMVSSSRFVVGSPGGLGTIAVEGSIFATEGIVTLAGFTATQGANIDGQILFGGNLFNINSTEVNIANLLRVSSTTVSSSLDVNGTFEMNLYDGVVSTE